MKVSNQLFLTNEQQIELREWEKLFKLPAWKWLVESAVSAAEQQRLFLVNSAMTEGDLRQARGIIKTLELLINTEEIKEAQYSQMTDSAELTRDELKESAGANS